MPMLAYLLICLIVGLMGMNKKFGFWGYFFGSIILTPVLGLVLVLVSDPKKRDGRSEADSKATPGKQKPDVVPDTISGQKDEPKRDTDGQKDVAAPVGNKG